MSRTPIREFLSTYSTPLLAATFSVAFAGYAIITGGNGGLPDIVAFVRHAPVESPLSEAPAHRIVPTHRLLPDAGPVFVDPIITGSVDKPHEPEGAGKGQRARSGEVSKAERRPEREKPPRYVLRFATQEMALVEGEGRLWDVAPGDVLPGLGRVMAIERKKKRGWVVKASDGERIWEIGEER